MNIPSASIHATWYTGSGEGGTPQGYAYTGTIALHLFVPSNAKNTQVGLQLPPEGTPSQAWSPTHNHGQEGCHYIATLQTSAVQF